MKTVERNGQTPLKAQLENWISRQIQTGQLKHGTRIDSINQLAARFKISRETVRQALDSLVQKRLLSPEHGRGFYVQAPKQRMLHVALLTRIDGVYVRPICEGLQEQLSQHAALFLVDLRKAPVWSQTIRSMAYQHSIDHLLVVPPRGLENELHLHLQPFRRYFKVAWLDRSPSNTRDPSFLCDYPRCVTMAMEHFKSLGITECIYFSRSREDQSVFSLMRKSFEQFQKQERQPPHFFNNFQKVIDKIQLRHRGKSPLGIIAETDQEAVFLQTRLLQKAIRIPQEASLISCDNSNLTEMVSPTLTAIDPQFQELGRLAGKWIQGEIHFETPRPSPIRLEPLLIKKESCIG